MTGEADGTDIPLGEGDVVDARWVVRRVLNGVGDCTTYVADDVHQHGRPVALWLFADRQRGVTEARLRERVQSRGIAAYVDSGPHGRRSFLCTAYHQRDLRTAATELRTSDAPIDDLHRLAGRVARGVILALQDLRAAASDPEARIDGRAHHGRISPEAVLIAEPNAVLAHLGDVGDPAAHRAVGDESTPFRPADVDPRFNSETVDVWMVGSLIHWVFTGDPAPARLRVDSDERIPAGWRPFLRGSLATRSGARVSLEQLEQRIPTSARVAPAEHTETWDEFGRLIRGALRPIVVLVGGAVQPTADRLAATARTAPTSAAAAVVIAAAIAWSVLGRPTDASGVGMAVLMGLIVGFGVAMGRIVVGAAGLLLGQWIGIEITQNVVAETARRPDALAMLGAVGATLVVAWIREFHRDVRGLEPRRVDEATALWESGRAAVIGASQQLGVLAVLVGLGSTSWIHDRTPIVWALLSLSVAAWDATGVRVRSSSVAEPAAVTRAARRLLVAPIRVLARIPALCTTRRTRGSLVVALVLWAAGVAVVVGVFRNDVAELGALAQRQLGWQWLASAPVLVASVVPALLIAGAATAIGVPAQRHARMALGAVAVLAGVLAVRAAWTSDGVWVRAVVGGTVACVVLAMIVGGYGRAAHRESGVTTLRNGLAMLAALGAAVVGVAWATQFGSVAGVDDERLQTWVDATGLVVPAGWQAGSFAPVDRLSAGPGGGDPVVGPGGLRSEELGPLLTWLRGAAAREVGLSFVVGDVAVGPVAAPDGVPDSTQRLVAIAVTVDQGSGDGGSVDLTDRVALVFHRSGADADRTPLGDYRTRVVAPSGDAVDLDVVLPTLVGDVDGNGTLDQPIGSVLDFATTSRPSFALVATVPTAVADELRLVAVVVADEAFAASARAATGFDLRPVLDPDDLAAVGTAGTWAPTLGAVEPVGLEEIRLEES